MELFSKRNITPGVRWEKPCQGMARSTISACPVWLGKFWTQAPEPSVALQD